MSNWKTWRAADVVDEYARAAELQEPEKAVFKRLKTRLPRMRMLDIGIGGGRTTLHFAPRTKEYTGIDISAEMIAACEKRFRGDGWRRHTSFILGDARDMSQFSSDSFDFILFSFNGIDYIPARHRARVFKEVRRVGKNGALFLFSTHNVQWMESATGRRFRDEAVLNDGVHQGRLRTHYGRPAAQVAQLRRYFTKISVHGLGRGGFPASEADLDRAADPWLYYLCAIEKDLPEKSMPSRRAHRV